MRRREFIAGLGGAPVCPLTARAQQTNVPVIGYLGPTSAKDSPTLPAFLQGLKQTGLVEGQNVAIEYRWAEGRNDRLPALAADLVNRRVAVIAANGGQLPAIAAKAATSTIPIVFNFGGDPVRQGLVASLGRPGGNATGSVNLTGQATDAKAVQFLRELVPATAQLALLVNPTNLPAGGIQAQAAARELRWEIERFEASTEDELDAAFAAMSKQKVRLELLHTLAPVATPIAVLINPANLASKDEVEELEGAAHVLGVRVGVFNAGSRVEIDTAFTSLAEKGYRALVVSSDNFFNGNSKLIAALAARYGLPASYAYRTYAEQGGLMSYGPDNIDSWRLVAIYAGRILSGVKPADLPVTQPTKFEMVVNMNTAKALGLTIPPNLLALADEVIE